MSSAPAGRLPQRSSDGSWPQPSGGSDGPHQQQRQPPTKKRSMIGMMASLSCEAPSLSDIAQGISSTASKLASKAAVEKAPSGRDFEEFLEGLDGDDIGGDVEIDAEVLLSPSGSGREGPHLGGLASPELGPSPTFREGLGAAAAAALSGGEPTTSSQRPRRPPRPPSPRASRDGNPGPSPRTSTSFSGFEQRVGTAQRSSPPYQQAPEWQQQQPYAMARSPRESSSSPSGKADRIQELEDRLRQMKQEESVRRVASVWKSAGQQKTPAARKQSTAPALSTTSTGTPGAMMLQPPMSAASTSPRSINPLALPPPPLPLTRQSLPHKLDLLPPPPFPITHSSSSGDSNAPLSMRASMPGSLAAPLPKPQLLQQLGAPQRSVSVSPPAARPGLLLGDSLADYMWPKGGASALPGLGSVASED